MPLLASVAASEAGFMTATAIVETTDFSYNYGAHGEFAAVRGVNLSVEKGELYALLGTNGAGKTTTLETLEGHRRPSAGSVRVFGGDPTDRARIRPRMGVMLQEAGFAGDLTVAESVALTGAISGRDDSPGRVLDAVGLSSKSDVRVAQLSGGEKRRLDFASAIWGTPELLFLDEPTTGLDPSARDALWAVARGLREQGVTIILTTHYLEEAQDNADRIGLMHQGVLQREGTLAELVRDEVSRITFVAPGGLDLPLTPTSTENGTVTIETKELQRDLTALLVWADRESVRLDRLSATGSSLADVFRGLSD
jgi:ABC-2 type transport system ATP-binding protein